MDDPTRLLLLYFIMPVWFLAGFADYLCHRATDIAQTTGSKESLLHLLMFGEIAVPLLMCLFLDINALVFAAMIVAFIAHEATALWDVSYAIDKRYVSPIEQHVHSFLEMIPLMAGSFVAVLHWPQLLALFGLGAEPARFAVTWKSEPVSVYYIAAMLGAALLFELLPYLEELWRGLKAGHRLNRARSRIPEQRTAVNRQ
jgi:hypothetical protein